MNIYKHIVQYYETDKMGITHHSNYIRWMEEARIDFLNQIGWSYAKLEEAGIVSPIISVNCNYKRVTQFYEEIAIKVKVAEFKGVKLFLEYVMLDKDGNCVCEGTTVNAFLDGAGNPVKLKKDYPELYETLISLVGDDTVYEG